MNLLEGLAYAKGTSSWYSRWHTLKRLRMWYTAGFNTLTWCHRVGEHSDLDRISTD